MTGDHGPGRAQSRDIRHLPRVSLTIPSDSSRYRMARNRSTSPSSPDREHVLLPSSLTFSTFLSSPHLPVQSPPRPPSRFLCPAPPSPPPPSSPALLPPLLSCCPSPFSFSLSSPLLFSSFMSSPFSFTSPPPTIGSPPSPLLLSSPPPFTSSIYSGTVSNSSSKIRLDHPSSCRVPSTVKPTGLSSHFHASILSRLLRVCVFRPKLPR